MQAIFQDWAANAGTRRVVRLALVLFRFAQLTTRGGPLGLLRRPATYAYQAFAETLAGFELPVRTVVGPRLVIWHGYGLVVNEATVIGADVQLRQGVTLGAAVDGGPSPVLADGVAIGPGASVLGGITVGAGASVGAHALVTTDVPPGGAARAEPSRVLPPR